MIFRINLNNKSEKYISLFPVGELDANTSIDLDERIGELIETNQVNIHVSLEKVDYISSAGLGVFISHLDVLGSKNGKLVLSKLNETVMDVFELLGLSQLLIIAKDGENIESYFK